MHPNKAKKEEMKNEQQQKTAHKNIGVSGSEKACTSKID